MRTSSISSLEGSQKVLGREVVSQWCENTEKTFLPCLSGCLEETGTSTSSSQCSAALRSAVFFQNPSQTGWIKVLSRMGKSNVLQESWKHATIVFCLKQQHSLLDLKPQGCTLQKGMLGTCQTPFIEFKTTICMCDLLLRSFPVKGNFPPNSPRQQYAPICSSTILDWHSGGGNSTVFYCLTSRGKKGEIFERNLQCCY